MVDRGRSPACRRVLPPSVSSASPGWQSVPVKEEIRRNAVAKIAAGEPLFDGVLGYEDTVLPQLENALLAGHDVIFLGERGQAKTRMIRSLTGLLDEWMPIVAGSEINDDPYAARSPATPATSSPSTATTRRSTGCTATTASARSWPRPTRRSPTSSARSTRSRWPRAATSSDELTLHYGLVPRTNRGIFAINELPDLAERIQVGLLNVLEERDVQIRGYKIRLPARRHAGRVGQPRGLHQPRPHHHPAEGPLRQPDPHALPARRRRPRWPSCARRPARGRSATSRCAMPDYMERDRRHVQPPGPGQPATSTSAPACRCACRSPTSRCSAPTPCAAALRAGENDVVPRVSDLEALAASTSRQGRDRVAGGGPRGPDRRRTCSRPPCSRCSRSGCRPSSVRDVIAAFDEGVVAHTGEDVAVGRLGRAGRAGAGAARAGRRA